MNKKVRLLLVLLISGILISFPTVFSYMIKETEQIINTLDPAIVTCDIVESFDGTTKSSIAVKNTGNVATYVRLKIVHYMRDSKGNIVGQESYLDTFDLGPGWILDVDSPTENTFTYYYIYPIYPEQQAVDGKQNVTNDLLSAGSNLVLKSFTNTSLGVPFTYYQAVELHAEAIQANPQDAVIESWGVVLDSNGHISSVN